MCATERAPWPHARSAAAHLGLRVEKVVAGEGLRREAVRRRCGGECAARAALDLREEAARRPSIPLHYNL